DCETPLVGPFCHACGQRDEPPDLPLRRVLSEALGDLLAWDGRVLQTGRTLLRAPGQLASDWAAGRRSRHVAPIRLYLLCSLVFVALSGGYAVTKGLTLDVAAEDAAEQEELRENLSRVLPTAKIDAVVVYLNAMSTLGSQWFFVLMPLGGFGLFVLYGLRRRSYPAHFVLAIHVFCVAILLLAARRAIQTGVLLAMGEKSGTLNIALLLGAFAVAYVYAALSIRRFYGVGWVKAIASAPAVTVGPVAAWVALISTGMVLILAWP
ncbi:MAG: DUF3667 domain-containing protein, partial [Bacteroidota bacterium]